MKERKVAEVMFSNEVSGDSLIQLKDGKLIFYYFRENSFLQIYNDKTLQKIKKINLFKPINKYQKEKEKGKDIKDDKLGKELEDEKEKEKKRMMMKILIIFTIGENIQVNIIIILVSKN